jgi:hypothetical protein
MLEPRREELVELPRHAAAQLDALQIARHDTLPKLGVFACRCRRTGMIAPVLCRPDAQRGKPAIVPAMCQMELEGRDVR